MINVSDVIDGKYRVTRILGVGGMGMVVEAYHDALDTHVAIKFMRAELVASRGGTERFLREARALVKLKSQHAVKVHDMGVFRRMPYIVMEHLEGLDLQTMLDKHGRLSAPDAARHIRQACEAIAEAHSLGIYHRDLKPANLFLARGASNRIVVKVLDFGIAKMMGPSDDKQSQQTSLTGANVLMGTLPYMSPEQIVSPKSVDGRSDIWSLGVVLHELVTGDLPFQGQDLYEMQQAIRFETCLLPAIPSSLAAVIRRCLEKNPDERYQSAVELAQALRPVVQESFSPFGTSLPTLEARGPKNVAVQDATKSPLPIPKASAGLEFDLASAEGLPVPANPMRAAETVAVPRAPDVSDLPLAATLLPTSDEAITLRTPRPTALTGTLIMNPPTPEPPTVKRMPSDRPGADLRTTLPSNTTLPAGQTPIPGTPRNPAVAHFQEQVQPVRRSVLVVDKPLQMAPRGRVRLPVGRAIMGALMLVILFFGWNAYCGINGGNVTSIPDAAGD